MLLRWLGAARRRTRRRQRRSVERIAGLCWKVLVLLQRREHPCAEFAWRVEDAGFEPVGGLWGASVCSEVVAAMGAVIGALRRPP